MQKFLFFLCKTPISAVVNVLTCECFWSDGSLVYMDTKYGINIGLYRWEISKVSVKPEFKPATP